MRSNFRIVGPCIGTSVLSLWICHYSNAFSYTSLGNNFGHGLSQRSRNNKFIKGVGCNLQKNDDGGRIENSFHLASANTFDQESQFVEEMPRPDPSTLVAAQDPEIQEFSIYSICTFLFFGSAFFVSIFNSIEYSYLRGSWLGELLEIVWPPILGIVFMSAGVSHLMMLDAYASIIPPMGSWGGLWDVPAPGAEMFNISYERYHSFWSGLAKLGGGFLLWASGVGLPYFPPVQFASALLALINVAITPANIYMFTHDAQMKGLSPVQYPEGHMVRGIVQCMLFALFWKLTFH